MSQIDVIVKELNKKYGNIANYGVKQTIYDKIRFTSPRLNYMCFGGLPVGRIYEFAGPEGSGKTSTVLDIIKNAQEKYKDTGKKILFVDEEGTFDYVWANKFGVKTEELLIITPETAPAEEVFNMMRDLIATGEICLAVLDSIATLVPSQLYGEDYEKKSYGGIALALTRFCNEVKGLLLKNDCTLIMINQVRDDINSPYGGTITPGGRAFKHACSARFEFRKGKFIDENGKEMTNNAENPAGNIVHVVIKKTKVFEPTRRVGYYTIRYLNGPDFMSDYIDVGLQVGIINQRGAYYDIIDTSTGEVLNEEKIQGKAKLKEILNQHEDWIILINNAMNDKNVEEVVDSEILANANQIINTANEG